MRRIIPLMLCMNILISCGDNNTPLFISTQNFISSIDKSENDHQQVKLKQLASIEARNLIITKITSLSITPLSEPYTNLKGIKDSLMRTLISTDLINNEIKLLKERFVKYSNGLDTISSTDTQWALYIKDQDRIETLRNQRQKHNKDIKRYIQNRSVLIKQHKIRMVSQEELYQILTAGSKHLDKMHADILHLHNELKSKNQQKLLKNKDDINSFNKLLTNVLTNTKALNSIQMKINKLTDQVNNEFNGATDIWTGPGMSTYNTAVVLSVIKLEAEKKKAQIQQQVEQIENLF